MGSCILVILHSALSQAGRPSSWWPYLDFVEVHHYQMLCNQSSSGQVSSYLTHTIVPRENLGDRLVSLAQPLFSTTEYTQFPQSHIVRNSCGPASGADIEQKYEKSQRDILRIVRSSRPHFLYHLEKFFQPTSAIGETDLTIHASDSALTVA